jgi:flagellar L-ring protein precursor FlgH
MRAIRWLSLATLIALSPLAVHGDSIWERRDPRALLFVDSRARRVGDVLSIVIQETTGIAHKDELQTSKDTAMGGILSYKGDSSSGKGSRAGALDFSVSGSSTRSFDGKSQYNIDHSFADQVGVTVIDVLPNGNLVVEGLRRITVGPEERTIRISGIVRPNDISLANTVVSQAVANFQITYVGKGAETRFSTQGYWGRALNILWPF